MDTIDRERRDISRIMHVEDWEKEIQAVFSEVEKHAYVITLHFATAEEFMEYIQQVCRSVRGSLELRRREFLKYLEQYKNEQGQFTFERDTYLYCCRKEE